ncbi:MAG TPA: asparaginase [Actinomycetales bacterium]
MELVRSGFVESVHHGSLVVLGADGGMLVERGEHGVPIFPRSTSKPLQAVAMLRAGLDLDGELLALAASSHSGEPFHLDGVRRLLGSAGLGVDDLQNTPDLPYDEQERRAYVRADRPASALAQNCSGKHAGMLAACVAAGYDTSSYLDPDHPLQELMATTLGDLAGEPVGAIGVDGCGAPVMALSLVGLARAFARIATAAPGTPEGRVATAIRDHPRWLGGTRRDVSALIEGVPGLIAKDGAEAVYAAALPDGRAVALKIADGSQRARPVVMVAALRAAGVSAAVLDELAETPVLGHGRPVGSVRALPLG